MQDGKDDKDDLVQVDLTLDMDAHHAIGDKIALQTAVAQDVAAALGSDLMHVHVLGLRADSGVVVVTVYICMHIYLYVYIYIYIYVICIHTHTDR